MFAPQVKHGNEEGTVDGFLLLAQAIHTHIISTLCSPFSGIAQTGAFRVDDRATTRAQIYLAHLVDQLQDTRKGRYLTQHIQNFIQELCLADIRVDQSCRCQSIGTLTPA